MNSNSRKTALVTGASSGIGHATAEALARAGFTVFGTSRKPSGKSPGQVSCQNVAEYGGTWLVMRANGALVR